MVLIADIALLAFVPFALLVFFRRHGAAGGVIRTVIWGTCFLPETNQLDLPLIPAFHKGSMVGIACFVGTAWKAPHLLKKARPFRGIDALFALYFLAAIPTALTNLDPIITGPSYRHNLSLYDAISMILAELVSGYFLYLSARATLRGRRQLDELLKVLVQAGFVYVALALWELRMSPRLHYQLYGESPMLFNMAVRYGGYRPIIFMETGMAVGLFFAVVAVMTAQMAKLGKAPTWVALVFFTILILCKSTGAILYGIVLVPLVALTKRPHARIAAAICIVTMAYPFSRAADAFPADELVEFVTSINKERGGSIWFRFDQEGQVLERTRDNRFFFGWGANGRSHIINPENGEDMTVLDGYAIIVIARRGILGFLFLFGLLTIPAIRAPGIVRRLEDRGDKLLYASLANCSAIYVLDLLPNGRFNDLPIFFAGALLGIGPGLLAEQRRRKRAARRARRDERLRSSRETKAQARRTTA